jgi:hypothetical protein
VRQKSTRWVARLAAEADVGPPRVDHLVAVGASTGAQGEVPGEPHRVPKAGGAEGTKAPTSTSTVELAWFDTINSSPVPHRGPEVRPVPEHCTPI